MDQGPLVSDQIEAGAKLARELSSHYKPLKAAFWLKDGENGRWYLYLVPERTEESDIPAASAEIIRLMGSDPQPWLDSFQVKVLTTNHPLAQAVVDKQQKYGNFATRLRGMLGGRFVEETFVYPAPIAPLSQTVKSD